MIKHPFDTLSMWWLTKRHGEGWPMFGWHLKDGPTLDLGIKRDREAEERLRSVNSWTFIAPPAELPPDYRLPSTAPIPENPDAWVVAPEPERNDADIIADLDFAGVEHQIQWCRTHDSDVRPGSERCYYEFEWGEHCNVVNAMLRLRPE